MSAHRFPSILVTTGFVSQEPSCELRSAYVNSLRQAGGMPLLVCPVALSEDYLDALLQKADGVLLTGGKDIHPRYFGEEPLEGLGEVMPLRDSFEIELARQAVLRGIPTLGICRGMQVLNVAFGGSVYQDIANLPREPAILHRQTNDRHHEWHQVRVVSGSLLHEIMGDSLQEGSLWVNSIHHQAVNRVADGWEVSATASDGLVEAVELPGHPFALAVQWHPEELPAHLPVIQRLVEAAGKIPDNKS